MQKSWTKWNWALYFGKLRSGGVHYTTRMGSFINYVDKQGEGIEGGRLNQMPALTNKLISPKGEEGVKILST